MFWNTLRSSLSFFEFTCSHSLTEKKNYMHAPLSYGFLFIILPIRRWMLPRFSVSSLRFCLCLCFDQSLRRDLILVPTSRICMRLTYPFETHPLIVPSGWRTKNLASVSATRAVLRSVPYYHILVLSGRWTRTALANGGADSWAIGC